MTQVSFHFNMADRLGYACRLLRKAQQSGSRVIVVGPQAVVRQLDQELWTFSALDFVAHCLGNASPAVLQASAIVLVDDLARTPHAEVLLNLHEDVPAGAESFDRIIELVSTDELERQAARRRWKSYQERGYPIVRHDVAAAADR